MAITEPILFNYIFYDFFVGYSHVYARVNVQGATGTL